MGVRSPVSMGRTRGVVFRFERVRSVWRMREEEEEDTR